MFLCFNLIYNDGFPYLFGRNFFIANSGLFSATVVQKAVNH